MSRAGIRDSVIIVLLGTLVRLQLFFMFDYKNDLYTGDSTNYLDIGRNIMEYGVHGTNTTATFFRPPLYSFFAGVIANASETAAFFYIVQSTLFISFAVAVYFLLCRYGVKLAFLSALLIAASPFDALMNGRVMTENLVTPLLVLGTLVFVNSDKYKVRFFISGALLGGAALSRDIYLLFPVFLLVAAFYMKIGWRHQVMFVLGFVLLVAPWSYRNSQLPSGGLFLSKGILWTNLWIGAWEQDAAWTVPPHPYSLPPEAFLTFDDGNSPTTVANAYADRDETFFRRITIDYMLRYPLKVLQAWGTRYPLLWFGTRLDTNTTYLISGGFPWYLMKVLFYLMNALVVIFGTLGLIVSFRFDKLPLFLCLPIIYNSLIYIPFHNIEQRYSLPVMPLLIIYSSLFTLYAVEKYKSTRGAR